MDFSVYRRSIALLCRMLILSDAVTVVCVWRVVMYRAVFGTHCWIHGMCVWVCTYVCMYVCVCVYMYVCVYVCICERMYVCMDVRVYVYLYMYVCIHSFMYVCTYAGKYVCRTVYSICLTLVQCSFLYNTITVRSVIFVVQFTVPLRKARSSSVLVPEHWRLRWVERSGMAFPRDKCLQRSAQLQTITVRFICHGNFLTIS